MEDEDSMDETLNKLTTVGAGSKHPTFRRVECEALVELVERHKAVLMSRQINGAALRAKDRVWAKIGQSFNASGFPVHRSVEHLRVKWENLKKSTRKKTSHLPEACLSESDELTRRVLALMCQAHDSATPDDILSGSLSPLSQKNKENEHDGKSKDNADSGDAYNLGEDGQQWDDYLQRNGDSESSQQNGDDGERVKFRKESRSMSFSPHACNVLLQCVRAEKKYIFSSLTNGKANRAKNHAWQRITQAFNKRIPSAPRTTKVLRTKFMNMKKRARAAVAARGGGAAPGDGEGAGQVFKKEKRDESEDGLDDEDTREGFDELLAAPGDADAAVPPADPLSSVLNGYTHTENIHSHEDCSELNQEVIRLKIELLKYQLETAKMERARVVAAAEGEAAERARRAELLSLRLRDARRPASPAPRYPPAERPSDRLHS